jgi:endogenous inhibitor of DNA gyrase (YacG/DUF329 family)
MSEPPRELKARICAYCGKPQEEKFRPFCSKRCADLDLAKWLNEDYAIPGGPPSEDSVDASEEGDF